MILQDEAWCPGLGRNVKLHIRLPEDYETSQERYPVMYMFDGHNLFDDRKATYGRSWRLDQFLNTYDKPFIIVGLECDHEGNNRLHEYCPYEVPKTPLGPLHGKGQILLDWMVHDLKPLVDAHFRTWPQRQATGIAGSSMGGLMAWYGLVRYNDTFSKAAALSPSLILCKRDALNEAAHAHIDPDTRLYISAGGREGRGAANKGMLRQFCAPLLKKGAMVKSNFIAKGQHNEASWEKESPVWFDYLWK